jgi:hypothetical protein
VGRRAAGNGSQSPATDVQATDPCEQLRRHGPSQIAPLRERARAAPDTAKKRRVGQQLEEIDMPLFTGEIEDTYCQMAAQDACIHAAAQKDPAMIAMVARPDFPCEARAVVIARIAAGEPLDKIAADLGRAPWLNLVAPTALGKHFEHQPMSDAFAAAIAPHIPADVERQRVMIKVVSIANAFGDQHIALMLAKRIALEHYDLTEFEIMLLAMFLAINKDPDIPAHRLIPRHMREDQSLQTLVRCAVCWFCWVLYETLFGKEGVADTYRPGGWFLGVEFVPLRTVEQFFTAARRYDNCVAMMAPLLLRDMSRIFELSQNGVPLGLVEIRMGGVGDAFLQLRQLEGPKRQSLKSTYERAVYAMLAAPPAAGSLGRSNTTGHAYPQARVLTQRFRALFGSYLDQHDVSAFLPSQVNKRVIEALLVRVFELGSIAQLDGVIGLPSRHPRRR